MKKISLIISGLLLTSVISFAKNPPTNGGGNCMQEGSIAVDVYYGFPNFYTNLLKSTYANSNATGVTVAGFGPIGGRFEYMASHRVGIGFDVNYVSSSVSYVESNLLTLVNYDYKITSNLIRAMASFALHFGQSEKFDAYWGVRAGYRNRSFKYTSTDLNYDGGSVSFNFIPIAFRTYVGARYFFSNNIGLNMEIGVGGGPVVAAGISLKF